MNEACRAIVIEYLLHNCYKNTAKALLKDMHDLDNCSKVKEDMKHSAWHDMDTRKEIHHAIREGDIAHAFELIQTHFPDLMEAYNTHANTSLHDALYQLRCQQFIEILRAQGDMEAVQFAQQHIRPWRKLYPEITNNVLILIAYNELENDKTRELLSQERRDNIADKVNKVILESRQFSSCTSLEKLWRQKIIVQVELDNQRRQESFKKATEKVFI
ncbi:CTLH/CRA C-terminal to lish motif domain-containing protein [Gilbertella persicaria]|uniref:CTLH/CRA C-terminal to lish motif domain-containing protein n=1 Tax=Gilbertella persicaria TaxID=101096 RepID=UPI00222036D1|nr:CTLH/CRA C-terminal to lish motif domain-containing protein [Gilbertella persicaria]KAI8071126.1 CTLH/CRA C-terminal to lish motif domain-containing protein [Gilbertella persicaria]